MEDKKIYSYLEGKEINMEELVKDYINYVKAIIKNSYIKLPEEDNEEIIVDVFLSFWKNKDKLDINKKTSPYIASITNNLLKKKCRNLKVISSNIDDYMDKIFDDSDIETDYFQSEINKEIINLLDKLKKEDKDIFILYYYENRKIKEISLHLNMSEEKVKSKLFRTRKRIREMLKKGGY